MEIKADYKNRIDRVLQYIDENFDADLSLNTISKIAYFSPFHFHRVFKFIIGETLNEYVTRRRVEKSALELIHKEKGVTDISMTFGFKDSSSFTRTFKKFYGVSPSDFRKQNFQRFSKIRQLQSKNGQAYPTHEEYLCIIDNLKKWIKMNAKIEVKNCEAMNVAYVSTKGMENIEAAYGKIMQWAAPRGLMNEQTKMVTIYYDSLKVTEPDKIRMSASILLSKPVEATGEINLKTIDAGRFIIGRFEIGLTEFEKSWTGLFVWMNDQSYELAKREPFAVYHNDYNTHPERKCIVDLCIPIL